MKDKETIERPHFIFLGTLAAVAGGIFIFYLIVATGLVVALAESL